MQRVKEINSRDEMIAFGISLAQEFLAARDDPSQPIVIILNGDENSGKELIPLACHAECEGESTIPKDRHADVYLAPDQRRSVVFANFNHIAIGDDVMRERIREFKAYHSGAKFIILQNLHTRLFNMINAGETSCLPEELDAHVHVKKLSESDRFFERFDREITTTSHGTSLG